MWRGVSLRTISLLLVGPMVIDMLMACLLFAMNISAVNMGVPPRTQLWIGTLQATGYVGGAYFAGRWVTPKIAKWCILIMGPLVAALGTAPLAITSFPLYLVISFLVGLAISHYYVPFQILMGDVRPFRTLAWTIAFYNISWGTGFAIGPMVTGFVGDKTVLWTVAAVWLLAAIHFVVALLAIGAPKRTRDMVHMTALFSSTHRMRWMSLVGTCLCLMIVMGLTQTIWPALGKKRGLTDGEVSLGVALLWLPTPILALLWAKIRRQFARPWMMIGSLAVTAVSTGALGATQTPGQAAVCLGLAGCAYSCVVFYGIYYANADPSEPHRSVAMYETLVGAGGMIGPLVLGTIAWQDAAAPRVYIACAAILLAATVAAFLMRERSQRAVAVSAGTQ